MSEKHKSSVSLLSEAQTIAQGQRRGRTGRNISFWQRFYGDKGERVGQVEALPWGQAGCPCMCLRAHYPGRPGSEPCVLPPGASGTSLAAPFLSPVAQK